MNLNGVKRLRASHRILFPTLAAMLVLALVGGVILAAMTINIPNTVTVIPAGGGGGGTPTPTYIIGVFPTAAADGAQVTAIAWDTLSQGYFKEYSVWVKNIGNADVSVTLSASTVPAGLTLTSTPAIGVAVPFNPGSVLEYKLKLVAASDALPGPEGTFNVAFDSTP